MTRKQLKKAGRKSLKKHYFIFVLLMLIATMLGSNRANVINLFNFQTEWPVAFVNNIRTVTLGRVDTTMEDAQKRQEELTKTGFKIGGFEVGYADGVLAGFINKLNSGSYFATVFSAVFGLTGNAGLARLFVVIGGLLVLFAIYIFIVYVFRVGAIRLFLEGRTYRHIKPGSAAFLIRVGKWFKVAMAMLRYVFFTFLWDFTIVGGIIMRYGYYMVPYVLAENPNLTGKEAIRLSRAMMKGHKWECFVLEISFLPWYFLNLITLGLVDTVYALPYREAVWAEYYAYIRGLAIDNGVVLSERLNDRYLFEKADEELINRAYEDVIVLMEQSDVELPTASGFRKFMADVFGIVLYYDAKEREYRQDLVRRNTIASFKRAIAGEVYPDRLNPIPSIEKGGFLENMHYLRNYSLTSLVLMFFLFSMVGWIWEVALHLPKDGFVNRGVLHGPWLPIYGSGGVMILIVLKKFRGRPILEFFAAIVLCGIVEFFTSVILEATKGIKWWDYSGYFLNIEGRVCAEGLLVFGLAGVAAVYVLGPILDNKFSRIPPKIAYTIAAALALIFVVDIIYSNFNPNVGKGITDYAFCDFITALPCGNGLLHI